MKASPGNMRYAIVLVAALVLVAYFALTFSNRSSPKILEVTDYSLNPDTINAGSSTTLSFRLKNDDSSNSHFVTVHFNASSMLVLWQGSQILPLDSGKQYFTETLRASDIITTSITVKATLPSQTSVVTYPIVLDFFVDGSQFDSKQVNLKVQG